MCCEPVILSDYIINVTQRLGSKANKVFFFTELVQFDHVAIRLKCCIMFSNFTPAMSKFHLYYEKVVLAELIIYEQKFSYFVLIRDDS